MSMILYLLVSLLWNNYQKWMENHRGITETIVFISSSSLWIYLWHIFFLEYWHRVQYKYPVMQKYLVSFISIAFLATATAYLQKILASKIIKTTQFGQNNSEMLAILFLK
jgi:peptidoglycan/LPS O-acetylase OafA/YrhL